MGEVYRARDTRLGRSVAVKILPETVAGDAQRRARFEREARAIAALNHPGICTIHDVGHDQGIDFLVMEIVDGESLATRLRNGPLPLDQALARAIEIADALAVAHAQGIIHRDLKPGNVMLTGTRADTHGERAKLLDFGLARIVPSGVDSHMTITADTTPLTVAGGMLGTLQYMAPEQIEGRPADARADIFAFGALLFEMVTGRRAFEGDTTAALMAAILRADAPFVRPHELDRIVRRCLSKDPGRRYQSTLDLLRDLEDLEEDLAAGRLAVSHDERRRGGRPAAWVALGLLAIAAVAGGFGWLRRSDPTPVRVERLQLQPPGVEILPAEAGSVLAISPDGQWVAFRVAGGPLHEPGLYVRFIGELEGKKIAPAGTGPFFSPDSRWLAFFADNALYKVPVSGGRPERIGQVRDISSVRGASWGRDGTIVYSSETALWRVAADGGEPAALTRPAENARHFWPHVLPDGSAAVFTLNQGVDDRWRHIALVSLKTGDVRTLRAASGTAPRFIPTGHLVYTRFGILHVVPFDVSRQEVTGDPVRVPGNLGIVDTFTGSGSAAFDVSATGSLVYVPRVQAVLEGELLWLDRDGGIAPLLDERKRYISASLDPAGTRLVVTIADDIGGGDLSVYDIERGAWSQLTVGMEVIPSPLAWSPDGKWIFFTSFKSGNGELFRMPSAGGTPERLTSDATVWSYPGSVSPDGTTLLFWSSPAGRAELMTLTLEPRGTPKPFGASRGTSERSPQISPDGRWVAYQSNESGSHEIHVRPFQGPGEGVRVSPNGGTAPWWNPDGGELFYRRGPEVWTVAIEPGDTFRYVSPRRLLTADRLSTSRGSREVGALERELIIFGGDANRFLAIRRDERTRVGPVLVYVPNWVEELKQALRQPP